MTPEDDLPHRIAAIEGCLVALLAERFNARPDPVAALEEFDSTLAHSGQLALKGIAEAAVQEIPAQPPEAITALVRLEAELAEAYRIALLNRVRRLLLHDG